MLIDDDRVIGGDTERRYRLGVSSRIICGVEGSNLLA
jgi:hypothetical protein